MLLSTMGANTTHVPDQILRTVDYFIAQQPLRSIVEIPIAWLPGPFLEGGWTWDDVAQHYRDRGWSASFYQPTRSTLSLRH